MILAASVFEISCGKIDSILRLPAAWVLTSALFAGVRYSPHLSVCMSVCLSAYLFANRKTQKRYEWIFTKFGEWVEYGLEKSK